MLNELDYAIETFDLAELKSTALALINGSAIELDDRLSWLREFDAEELQEMLNDIRDRGSVDGEDEVIHEWHESALLIQSGVLDGFNLDG